MLAPVDDMKEGSEAIAPEGVHELGVNLRVSFEMIGNAGARLDFAKEMAEWRRAEPLKMLDEALALEPGKICLRRAL
jgi:hypothetical protein